MSSDSSIRWSIRHGLAFVFLMTVGWQGSTALVEPAGPIFFEVCDPVDGTPCQELTSATAGGNWSRDVALGDLNGDGTVDAVVVQGGGSSPQSNVIWLGDSGGDCANPFDFDLNFCEGALIGGGDSRAVGLRDLDGDTDLDVFIANGGVANNDDEVWLNQGGTQGGTLGAFSLAQGIANGASEAVVLADLNGDTYPDAVVVGSTQRIYWNLGNGTFDVVSPTVVAPNSLAYDVAVADLDGDGRPDIVLAGEGGSPFADPTQVFWIESSGPLSATITAGPVLATSSGVNDGLGVGRLNGDVYPDVFIANSSANKVWLSNGDRTFTEGVDLGTEADSNVALADLDGDGDLDAFVTRLVGFPSPNGIWLNDGSGGFSAGLDSLGTASSYAVALADMDGDGDPDAFVANSGPNKVYRNDVEDPVPQGFFVNGGESVGDQDLDAVALGDLDGDGDLDVVVTGFFNSYVWLNQGGDQAGTEGAFSLSQTLPMSRNLALGDLDGDGDPDLVLIDDNEPARLYLNQGGVQSGTPGQFADSGQSVGSDFEAVELGDVDGDADLDMMLLNGAWTGQLFINQGGQQAGTAGEFLDSGQSFPSDLYANDVYLHDADNDTDLDLFFPDTEEGLWFNMGVNTGVFVSGGDFGFFVHGGGFGDFDGDSDADLFAITDDDSQVYVNQGGLQGGIVGTFADGGQSLGSGYGGRVEIGDLTGDGIPDAFVAGYRNLNVWHNDGTGTFSPAQTMSGDDATDAALGDLDGDGDLDAFVTTANGGRIWLNGENGVLPSLVVSGTLRGGSGQYQLHWWGTRNAVLPLSLTQPVAQPKSVQVDFAYQIEDELGIPLDEDADTDYITFEAGETLKLATGFSTKVSGAEGEVWNFYQSTTTIPADSWPMDVILTPGSLDLGVIGPNSFQIYFHSPDFGVRNCFLEGVDLMLSVAGISFSSGAIADSFRAVAAPLDLDLFRNLRDDVLAASPQGRYYTDLYTTHSPELLQLTAANGGLLLDTLQLVLDWTPAVRDLVDGQGDLAMIDEGMVKDAEELLRAYKALAGPELRAAIEGEEAALDLPSFIGLDLNQALQKVEERDVGALFADGFEGGDTSMWSRAAP